MPESVSRNGWTRVAFGAVVQLSRERSSDPEDDGFERYVGLEHIEPGDLKIRRWGDIADGTTFTNVFRPGQVLFGKRRAYQRKVAVADFDGVCSGDIYVLEPKNDHLLPELLPFICQTEGFFEHAVGTSAGSLSPRTNWNSLAGYEFALPTLEQQRRIARLLLASEAARQRAQAAAEALETTVGSWLQARLGRIGVTRPLGDVLSSTEYGSSTHASEDRDGVPILRIPNVLRGELDLSEMKWVRLSAAEIEKYTLRRDDILIVRTNGNPDYVGRCLVVPPLPEVTVFASYLIRLVVDPSQVLAEYVASVLNSADVRRLLRRAVRSSAGNYNINTTGIRTLQVPLPPLPEQEAILAELAAFSEIRSRFQDRRHQIGAIQRAAMVSLKP